MDPSSNLRISICKFVIGTILIFILTSVGVIHIARINEVYAGCLTSLYGPVTTSSTLSLVFLKDKGVESQVIK